MNELSSPGRETSTVDFSIVPSLTWPGPRAEMSSWVPVEPLGA